MRYFFLLSCLFVFASSLCAQVDDTACVRNNCMGTCISRDEALHKATPMICHADYSCYQDIECAKKDDGNCSWEENQQFKDCIAQKKKAAASSLPSALR